VAVSIFVLDWIYKALNLSYLTSISLELEIVKPYAFLIIAYLFFYFPGFVIVETIISTMFGTTIGKAIFGIKIKSKNGEKAPVTNYLKSFSG